MAEASELRFQWEWEPAPGVRSPELRATWARLEILVGTRHVSLVEDLGSGSARRSIYCPLYPLAEWIAFNWWSLAADARPNRALDGPFPDAATHDGLLRHSLRSAGDGFRWPDLIIVPEGSSTRLLWRDDHEVSSDQPIRYLGHGHARTPRAQVERELAAVVGAVLTRLAEQGVTGTALHTEWAAVTGADEDEQEFCLAAARLGLDPYAETADLADDIIRAATRLGPGMAGDFLDAVDPENIVAGLEWIGAATEVLRSSGPDVPSLSALRSVARQGSSFTRGAPPWQVGWSQAGAVRDFFQIGSDRRLDIDQVLRTWDAPETGVPIDQLTAPIRRSRPHGDKALQA
ncbi:MULTISPECIES: hypothetical protein, partial [unclassified Frankia]|uniref:hypothetical protein n=1 Tax=unclassified Frankia TaxID=2632575 RepID=UPI002AD23727